MKRTKRDRAEGAYQRLIASKFFEKGDRTKEEWEFRKETVIKNLKKKYGFKK